MGRSLVSLLHFVTPMAAFPASSALGPQLVVSLAVSRVLPPLRVCLRPPLLQPPMRPTWSTTLVLRAPVALVPLAPANLESRRAFRSSGTPSRRLRPPASPASRRTQPSSLTPSSGGQWILRLSPEACVRTGRRPPRLSRVFPRR